MSEARGLLAEAVGRAAVGAIIGGPVGVVTALVTGGSLVLLSATFVAAGALLGALVFEEGDMREAAVDAILPIGAWLVGAAIGWVFLSTLRHELPRILRENPAEAALGAAVVGGTLAVVVLIVRLGRRRAE